MEGEGSCRPANSSLVGCEGRFYHKASVDEHVIEVEDADDRAANDAPPSEDHVLPAGLLE